MYFLSRHSWICRDELASKFFRSTANTWNACLEIWLLLTYYCHTARQSLQNRPSGHPGGLATLWSAEEMLDGQYQRVDISTYARTAHNGLLQKRLEEGLCWIVCHVPPTTQSVNGLHWSELNYYWPFWLGRACCWLHCIQNCEIDFYLWFSVSRDSLLADLQTRDRKVASSNPAGAAGEFSSPGLTLCFDSFPVSVPLPVIPQLHVKDPGHSSNSAGGRLHLNTHTPFTQRSRSGLTMPLSRHSVRTYQETSSQATRQETLGHSRLTSLSHCGPILA